MPVRVALVTSTRADWGLLQPLAAALDADPAFDLLIVVTGTHLSAAFGATISDITGAGFRVAFEYSIVDEHDDAYATIAAMGRATAGYGHALKALRPDLTILLGDRYEILGVAQASVVAGVPVAHLCGGDITEGAFDDSFRHAISKLAHLHYPTNAEAARRLRAMGEDDARIVVAGSTGLDTIRLTRMLDRDNTYSRLGLQPSEQLALFTFHPPTLCDETFDGPTQFKEIAAALDLLPQAMALVMTGSNADPAGRALSSLVRDYASRRPNTVYRDSLGQLLYLSAMRLAKIVIGNSSSGLYEAPSFKVPAINIGDRQKGRLRANSVIDVPPDRAFITAAIRRALDGDFSNTVNPYGDGFAAQRIVDHLRTVRFDNALLIKPFRMLEAPAP